ncbi:hypothetical protein NS365_17095 [Aureimonas ureilytica]|uniref:YjiS-like domain-containing protein n=1 Tax=Aureimonas ureilytica TaxID=401562 RepID=A0A175RM83_9HYPH|nr:MULTISPECIES: DUF1127 domain-containing protein [Aureimonas]KTQ95841.1 hypothetical protein NS226_10340 [Aureimonas ureilytica]KTR03929.1 hypothetical protein NS365_17095 [Aureimonas ureilytica]
MTLASKTPAPSVETLAQSIRIGFVALRAIVRTMRNRRAAYRMSELPDYLLNDIGLKRDDVHEALHADWREDPTYRLAVRASERRRSL